MALRGAYAQPFAYKLFAMNAANGDRSIRYG